MGEKELIYRADARRVLLRNYPQAAHCIERIRAVEVKEVVRANWTLHADGSGTCQHCHHHHLLVWDYDNWMHYCPTCGAEMIGAEPDDRMQDG